MNSKSLPIPRIKRARKHSTHLSSNLHPEDCTRACATTGGAAIFFCTLGFANSLGTFEYYISY
ncbi:uncharacterized protein ASPGLDRAFT_47731 [Aspergillus glaucus CBS 516.65]|uniref:Uncharacterized protein n=1 Tax=Aspergillus glaucus CBS 516.65 TaxID=1160497 RepID=A0A1L9VJF2_ASPGL|nr:hypothetical protein ASPGLDRAFT_47731 [Aspergillus glaucus CBS 516.65]OJJ84010.1 hypothetical protein ASPGLDRAFT_47731 [Aspergillus glaucus CBS 516.65]